MLLFRVTFHVNFSSGEEWNYALCAILNVVQLILSPIILLTWNIFLLYGTCNFTERVPAKGKLDFKYKAKETDQSTTHPPTHPPQWCKVLLEKPTVTQQVTKFPAFYETRRLITVLARVRHWSLHRARCVHSTNSHPISLTFILILSIYVYVFRVVYFLQVFQSKYYTHFSPLPYVLHVPPILSSRFSYEIIPQPDRYEILILHVVLLKH
jgi:hypothetical protein